MSAAMGARFQVPTDRHSPGIGQGLVQIAGKVRFRSRAFSAVMTHGITTSLAAFNGPDTLKTVSWLRVAAPWGSQRTRRLRKASHPRPTRDFTVPSETPRISA